MKILKRNRVGNWEVKILKLLIGRHRGNVHKTYFKLFGKKIAKPYISIGLNRLAIVWRYDRTNKTYYIVKNFRANK